MFFAALFALGACGGDDGNDPVDNQPVQDEATEQPDNDTIPVWVTDKTYAGLEWSPLSESEMTWQEAMGYCENMGGRLPNITELRKIIINCPGSTYGGACKISDPDCLDSSCYSATDCSCDGFSATYSALGDDIHLQVWLWSSSSRVGYAYYAWCVNFYIGNVSFSNKYNNNRVRCVNKQPPITPHKHKAFQPKPPSS